MDSENSFQIVPLNHENFSEAETLWTRIFHDVPKEERTILSASLEKQRYRRYLESQDVKDIHYELMVLRHSDKIVGITGIYTEIGDEEKACWLGWFGVDEPYQRKGFGQALLRHACNKAKQMECDTLKLYTHDSPYYQKAIGLYRKNGFEIYERKRKTLYFRKALV